MTTSDDRITLYYSPQTRATGTRVLLEELGAPYDLHVLNMKAGEQRQPAYLAVNPLGKVPAIRHGEALVTEQVAIYIHLADLFPKAGLALLARLHVQDMKAVGSPEFLKQHPRAGRAALRRIIQGDAVWIGHGGSPSGQSAMVLVADHT